MDAVAEPGVSKSAVDLDVERLRVAAALRALEQRLAALSQALLHCDGRFSCAGEVDERAAGRRIVEAYGAIDLSAAGEPNVSPVCLGVASVPEPVCLLAQAVNEAKAALKRACVPLQKVRMRVAAGSGPERTTRSTPVIRIVLRNIQRSDLNLLAAYRRIPVLDTPVRSVSYTRARTRSVYRKPVSALVALLEHSDKPGARDDRARLAILDPAETHLALVREHYENVRANVAFARPDTRGRLRAQIAAELPLLCSASDAPVLPAIQYPEDSEAEEGTPRRRRATRLEAGRFLATLPVYRYRKPPPA